jgi:hypothetical protein
LKTSCLNQLVYFVSDQVLFVKSKKRVATLAAPRWPRHAGRATPHHAGGGVAEHANGMGYFAS